MKNEKVSIYLAGTIYSDEPDRSWKKEFNQLLAGRDVVIYDPDPNFECEDIDVVWDKKCISGCDVVVAYIQKASFGTAMEIFYSYSLQTKYVIVINPNGVYFNDLWLRNHCHNFFDSVSTCCEWLKDYIVTKQKDF